MTTEPGPTPAERARTALAASPMLDVCAGGLSWPVDLHDTDPGTGTGENPSLLLVVAESAPVTGLFPSSTASVPARIRGAQLRVLPVADRVRVAVTIWGRLRTLPPSENAALLRLLVPHRCAVSGARRAAPTTPPVEGRLVLRCQIERVLLAGAEEVDLPSFRSARPDPLLGQEATFVRHLHAAHGHELVQLCKLVDPRLLESAVEISPAGLDRYGLILRVAGPASAREIRLPFTAPLDRACDVTFAMRELVSRARARILDALTTTTGRRQALADGTMCATQRLDRSGGQA